MLFFAKIQRNNLKCASESVCHGAFSVCRSSFIVRLILLHLACQNVVGVSPAKSCIRRVAVQSVGR